MSGPRNHHYVPQWLLTAWCSPSDAKLQSYFRLPDGTLSSQRRSPRGLASQCDLYRWQGNSYVDPTEVETRFFQKLDSRAARAAQILRTSGAQMPIAACKDWARFLSACLVRTPFVISVVRDMLRERVKKIGGDISVLNELLPGWLEDGGLEDVVDYVRSDRAVLLWADMRWWVESTNDASYTLLLSDFPLTGRTIEPNGKGFRDHADRADPSLAYAYPVVSKVQVWVSRSASCTIYGRPKRQAEATG
jgi:hypothetical protein